jgi:Pyruvate/2-oxoacid:ferredoxin oxidoreductase delta subunit
VKGERTVTNGHRATIYFFSGTGNAERVAGWAADAARDRGWTADVINIGAPGGCTVSAPEPGTMLGFISPTHGFNYPPIVLWCLLRFPRASHRNRVSLMNTRAGMKLGPLFLPGLSGLALWFAAVVLMMKGYRIAGMRPIDMPSNWISLHPALRGRAVSGISERCRRITRTSVERLCSGKRDLRGMYDLIQDALIAPVSLLYYCFGRFFFAKSFYANAACNNCDTCSKRCPVGAIVQVNGRPFWTFNCESCMRCMNECPHRAIETGHGYVTAVLIVSSVFLADVLWPPIARWTGFAPGVTGYDLVRFIADSVLTIGILALAYRLVHLVVRMPGIRTLLRVTSLTSYDIWGRYQLTKMLRKQARESASLP